MCSIKGVFLGNVCYLSAHVVIVSIFGCLNQNRRHNILKRHGKDNRTLFSYCCVGMF